jgi:hypothetical protein
VWLFDVTLSPGEQVPIVHDYRVLSTVNSQNGVSVDYVTRTGATWGRPIGRARFTFRYPARVCELYTPNAPAANGHVSVPLAAFRLLEEGGQLIGEASYEVQNWRPTGDVEFFTRACTIARDYWENERPSLCPAHELLWRFVFGSNGDRPDPPPPTREEVVQALAKLSDQQLRLCKNYPFAGYGRPFTDAALSQAFYGEPKPTPSDGPLQPFQPSAHYTDKLLTPGDWRWIKVVDAVLAQRPAPPPLAAETKRTEPPKSAVPPAPPPTPAEHTSSCSGCAIAGAASSSAWGWLFLALAAKVLTRRRESRVRAGGRRPTRPPPPAA